MKLYDLLQNTPTRNHAEMLESFIRTNKEKYQPFHDRIMNILHQITNGEILYGYSSGGYQFATDDEWWKDTFVDEEQYLWPILYDFYENLIDNDKNAEFSLCVLISNPETGKYPKFCGVGNLPFNNGIIPLVRVNMDGSETIYEYNISYVENLIQDIKDTGLWDTRKHWYDNVLEETGQDNE